MFSDPQALAQVIELALLRPDATVAELEKACEGARHYGFAALIVSGSHVKKAGELLAGSGVKVGAVVGFPHGASTTTVKIVEAMEAMKNGAEELDIVMNIGMLKSGRQDIVEIDIKNVIYMTPGLVHKMILETGYLTAEEIQMASSIAVRAGAKFIKTSTGFGPRGATEEDIMLIREAVGNDCRIKASGGIRTLDDVERMIRAGADRVGSSSAAQIMQEYLDRTW